MVYNSPFNNMLGANLWEREAEHQRRTESHNNAHIFMGIVVAVNQQKQFHQVRCAGRQFFCPALNNTASPLYGPRDSTLYPVGSFVLVATTGSNSYLQGVILGGIPPASASVAEKAEIPFSLSCELAPGTPVGPYKDAISAAAMKKALSGNAALNKNSGRPIDTYPGDIAHITELGCGFWAGRTLASLRAGHDVAVECHYTDSMLRLVGFNFERYTAGSDTTMFNDSGVYTEIRRLSPYIIESLGGSDPKGLVPSEEGESREDSKVKTTSRIPKEEEQVGYWRYLQLTGYLGDLDTVYVSAVREDAEEPRVAGDEFSDTQDYVGLFKRTIASDGAYTLQSAKSIMFSKDLMIPIPQEVYRPDDPRGSNPDDGYKPVEIEKTEVPFSEDKPYLRAATSHEILVRQANYTQTTGIQEHTEDEGGKDWSLKEISELKFGDETGASWEDMAVIGRGTFWAELPKTATIKVDPRNTEGKYFVSRSVFCMHEDGSVHIEDGYGSHISMRGGNMDLSCPGTMTLRPGNDLVALSGRSTSIVSGEDVEFAAMKGDARIHGNRNVTILGGNDGQGGVLIESKATGSHLSPDGLSISSPDQNSNHYNGILLKSSNSTVSLLGREAYIGCGEDSGSIVIDANDEGAIRFVGKSLDSAVEQMYLAVGDPNNLSDGCHMGFDTKGNASLMFNTGLGLYSDKVILTGAGQGAETLMALDGDLIVRNRVQVFDSVVSPALAEGDIPSIVSRMFDFSISLMHEKQEAVVQMASEAFEGFIDVLSSSAVRDTELLKFVTFCYPDTDTRGLPMSGDDPIFLESTWQRRYKSTGSGADMDFIGVKFSEEIGGSPEAGKGVSSPWPGADIFNSCLGQSEYVYVDEKTGGGVDRASGGSYTDSAPELTIGTLGNYVINSKNRTP